MSWQTARVADNYDVLAPDGSEIRVLVSSERGSMVHCTLRPGAVTWAVRHRSVEEVWYCLSGTGEMWRSAKDIEEVVTLRPGVAISIPVGASFQFRATSTDPLNVVITTMPPWPGPDEAEFVRGHWAV